jgi:hypothetical protein
MARDWRHIEYFVPIKEVLSGEKDFLIKGVAINDTTTRNNVRYKAEELQLSAPTLRNKPVLKDHNNSVESIVGRTTNNVTYDMSERNIKFEAVIKDKKMQEMISEGLISSVSVGAMVHDLVREESNGDSYMVAKGIDFVEISLVAVPADPNAGFEKAIAESFDLKEAAEMQDICKCEECGKSFPTKEELGAHMKDKHSSKTSEEKNNKFIGGTKMSEEVTESAKALTEEKNHILEEQNALLSKRLQEYAEKEMNALRSEYVALAKEKNITIREGYEKLSKEIVEVLIETLKTIKTVEAVTEKTKGEIVIEKPKTDETKDSLVYEKSGSGKFSLHSEKLGDISPRLKWRE